MYLAGVASRVVYRFPGMYHVAPDYLNVIYINDHHSLKLLCFVLMMEEGNHRFVAFDLGLTALPSQPIQRLLLNILDGPSHRVTNVFCCASAAYQPAQ